MSFLAAGTIDFYFRPKWPSNGLALKTFPHYATTGLGPGRMPEELVMRHFSRNNTIFDSNVMQQQGSNWNSTFILAGTQRWYMRRACEERSANSPQLPLCGHFRVSHFGLIYLHTACGYVMECVPREVCKLVSVANASRSWGALNAPGHFDPRVSQKPKQGEMDLERK